MFNFLPAGVYDVSGELTGFKIVPSGRSCRLEIGQNLALDLKMEVGQRRGDGARWRQSRRCSIARPRPSARSSSRAQLKELPLAGRHWAGLMLLAPGAINTGDGTHLSTRFVGRARDDNNWTFDGIDATGVKDPRQDSAARLIISSESIAEFRVGSSLYSAESGHGAGGQVQLISKTGTNQFRGTAYDFIRNDRSTRGRSARSATCRRSRLNQFGVNLGGPIVPQRTFFFVNYEGLRQRQTQSFTRFVPEPGLSGRRRRRRSPPSLRCIRQAPADQRCRPSTNGVGTKKSQADETRGLVPRRSPVFRHDDDVRPLQLRQCRHRQSERHRIHDQHNCARPTSRLQLQRIFGTDDRERAQVRLQRVAARLELRDGRAPEQFSVPGFVGADRTAGNHRGRPHLQRPR